MLLYFVGVKDSFYIGKGLGRGLLYRLRVKVGVVM